MRILLLNPNTSVGVTGRMSAVARAIAAPSTEIVPLTAPRGVPVYRDPRGSADRRRGCARDAGRGARRGRCGHRGRVRGSGARGFARARRRAGDRPRRGGDADRLHARPPVRDRQLRAGARPLVRGMRRMARPALAPRGDPPGRRRLHLGDQRPGRDGGRDRRGREPGGRRGRGRRHHPRRRAARRARRPNRRPGPGAAGRWRRRRRPPGETLVCLQPRKASAGSYRRPDPKALVGLPPAVADFLGSPGEEAPHS